MLTYNKCKEFKNIDKLSGRVYEVPVGTYPSVTTVLSQTKNTQWIDMWRERVGEEAANKILEEASERGTKVHGYIEELYKKYSCPNKSDASTYLQQLNIDTEPNHIKSMTLRLASILADNNYNSIAQEFVVWDDELKIAGRCDSIGYWNGSLAIVDFKTARKKKPIEHIRDYYLQATAYCKAHNRLFTDKVKNFVIVIVNEEGTSQIFTGNHAHYIPDLRYRVKKYYSSKEEYE
jgi:ATP-dependent exoDNAse (exonuclease V) beta subunit